MTTPTLSELPTARLYHATPAPTFTALGAVGVACLAVASFILVAGVALAAGATLILALVGGQLAMLAVPLGILRLHRRSVGVLGMRRPRARHLLAAALIGGSAWVLTSTLAGLLPHRDADRAALQTLAQAPAAIAIYLGVGLVPALCEEVVFRGVLVRGLASRLRPALAIGLTAAAFGAYHLNFAQLAPAFCLGLALGFLTLRAGSVLPAMLAHALNNVMALIVARDDASPLVRALENQPNVVLAVAAVLTTSGIVLAARPPDDA